MQDGQNTRMTNSKMVINSNMFLIKNVDDMDCVHFMMFTMRQLHRKAGKKRIVSNEAMNKSIYALKSTT